MTAALVILAMIAAGAVVYAYETSQGQPGSSVRQTTSTAINPGQAALPSVGVTFNSVNSLTAGAVSETNAAYNFYDCGSALGGKSFSQVTSLYGVAPTLSSLTKGSQSVFTLGSNSVTCGYGILAVYAGDNVYTDASKVLNGGNPSGSVSSFKWGVATSLSRSDLLVALNYNALGSPNYNLKPNLAVSFTNSEFVQTTIGSVTVTQNTATSEHVLENVGTSANTVNVLKWTIGGIASNDGVAVAKIILDDNDSTTAPTASFGAISFGDNLPADSPGITSSNLQYNSAGQLVGIGAGNALSLGYASSTVTHAWSYWPGILGLDATQVANAIILVNPAQSVGDTTISVPITTSLTSGECVNMALGVTLISGNGAATVISDSGIIVGAATC